jgi:hypothetical protein
MWQSKKARALEEDDAANKGLAEERKKTQEALEKHWKEGGSADLDAQRMRSQGNVVGARRAERESAWWKTYQSKLHELGDKHEKEAREFADLGATNSVREEGMMAAGMVNARSGTRDVARVVALASGDMVGRSGTAGREVIAAIREQSSIITWHHEEAKMLHVTAHNHRTDLRGRPL